MIEIEGTIQKTALGAGAWALVMPGGQMYEIYQGAPAELLHSGQKVRVRGTVRDDVVTTAMIGPILEVQTFEVML